MSEEEQNRRALSTLDEVRQRAHPDIDQALIETIFRIQERTQFDDDRSGAVRYVENVIREYVGKKLSENDLGG